MSLSPLARTARTRRCLWWLGAFVLLVLITTAGLPSGRDPSANGNHIEVVEGRAARPLAFGEPRSEACCPPRTDTVRPRPRPRTRSVSTRGLPPARAPTS